MDKERKQKIVKLLLIKTPRFRHELPKAFHDAYSNESDYSELSDSNISDFINADSVGRVCVEGVYVENDSTRSGKEKKSVLSYIADYNGIDCLALKELKMAQREHKIFPFPYIYKINSKTFMIEVNPRYVGYAKDMLSKMLTQRYLYEATTFSNQVVLFLMKENESTKFNKACVNESPGRYPCIDFEEYDTDNPLIEGLKTNEFLTLDNIKRLLLEIMKEKKEGTE